MARIFKLELEELENKSITYITRNRGEVGLDIAAVKLALGLIQSNIVAGANSLEDPAIVTGPQWFSCVDDSEVTIDQASRFDKFLETALMKFQLDNQFTIINYYFIKYSVPNILRFQTLEANLSESQQEVIKGKQLAAAESLFDSEFGKIGEGTLSLLHGWLNRTTFSNKCYYHEGSYSKDIIPLVIYDNFVKERYAQKPAPDTDIVDPTLPGFMTEPDSLSSEDIDTGKYERYPWSRFLPYKKIEVSKREEGKKSTLYSATEQLFQLLQNVPANQRDIGMLTEQETLDFINRQLEPDPNSHPDPYEIDENHYLVYVNTAYNYERNPPSVLLEEEKKEYEDQALYKIINFFDKPNIWSPNSEDPMFAISYPNVLEQELTPTHDGLLQDPSRFVLTTDTHISQFTDQRISSSVQIYSEIDEKKFSSFRDLRSPTLRPGDVYKAAVIIDRRKLDLILPDSIHAVRRPPDEEPVTAVSRFEDAASELSEQYCAFLDVKNRNISAENSVRFKEYKAFAKIQRRQILRNIKQKVLEETTRSDVGDPGDISMDLGVFGQYKIDGASVFDALRGGADFLSPLNPKNVLDDSGGMMPIGKTLYNSKEPGPKSLTFSTFGDLESHIEELVDFFNRSREGIDKVVFSDPKYSIDTEISFLKQITTTLKTQIKSSRSKDPTLLFGRSDDDIFETSDPNFFIGNISYEFRFKDDDIEVYIAGEPYGAANGFDAKKVSPFNRPRTVNYLRNVNAIIGEDLLGGFLTKTSGECGKAGTLGGRIHTILKYTKDLSLLSKDSVFEPIKNFWFEKYEDLQDWYNQDMTSGNTGQFGGGDLTANAIALAGLGTQAQYGAAAALPILSDKCDVAAIKEKFLKRFSLPLLLCDVFKCLKIPPINIKVPDFDIPGIPKWTAFKDISLSNFFNKILDILKQILKKIVCAYAQGILDILNTPFCGVKFEEQVLIPEINSDFDLPRRALLDALTDLGIPKTLEATDEAKELFENLTNVLTPSEICALLRGEEVSSEVYAIVSRMAQEKNLIFNSFQDTESIKNFFDTIGIFVDEDLCNQLGDFDEQLGTYTCEDTAALMRLLREKLISNNVTTSEIESALSAANRDLLDRAKALEVMSDTNALSALFPKTITPGAPGSPIQELPETVQTAAASTLNAFLQPAKFSYLSSLRSFGNSFYMESTVAPQPGDANYNGQAVYTLERALERLRTYNLELLSDPSPLPEKSLDDINNLLNKLCAVYEEEMDDSIPEPERDAPMHIKHFFIMNKLGETVEEGRFTSQTEVNKLLNRYNSTASADETYSVEVRLTMSGILELLKYPIMLPNVILVKEDSDSQDENISQIKNGQQYSRVLTATAGSDFQKDIIKIGFINKINERLLACQQEVVNNLEASIRPSFSSELLKNLREIFDANEEAIREFGTNELINVAKNAEGDIQLTARDTTSLTSVDYIVNNDPSEYEKYTISIKDPNAFSGYVDLNFCKKIPDSIIDTDYINANQAKDESFFKTFRNSFLNAFINTEINASNSNSERARFITALDSKKDYIKNDLFPAITESIFEKLFFEFYKSDIFNEDSGFVERISRLVAGELFLSESESGNLCITNKFELNSDSDLGFENVITKNFLAEIMSEFAKKENDVSNIDYSQLTATEKAMANLIVRALVRISILEVALKSSINLSIFSFTEMISTYEFREYLNQICIKNILNVPAFNRPETYAELQKTVNRITSMPTIKLGLIKLINEEIFSIATIIDKIYDKVGQSGSLYNFYINNLQNLDIPSKRSNRGVWKVDQRLKLAAINPTVYFENYIKLRGPLANPAIYQTPTHFVTAHEVFHANAPPVYDNLNIDPPSLNYLINYTNDINASEVSFLLDSTVNREIISIKDFRKLMETITGGPDSFFTKAERDIKNLFFDGPLAGRPKFFDKVPGAAYSIDTSVFTFKGNSINTYKSSEDDIRNSLDRIQSIGSREYYIEPIDGEDILLEKLEFIDRTNPQPNGQAMPRFSDDYVDYNNENPFVKCLKNIQGIEVLPKYDRGLFGIDGEIVGTRGITRKINLNLEENGREGITPRFKLTSDDQGVVFEEQRYGNVNAETFQNYPSDLKINIQQVVIDLIDDAAPIYDSLGEFGPGHTQSEWENLSVPSAYKSNMETLKELMKDDDPDLGDTEPGPFQFTGQTGCFVRGNFGLSFYEYEGVGKPPINNINLWKTCRQRDFNFRLGKYNKGHEQERKVYLMISGLSSDEQLDITKKRYLHDNEYEIPTRILLTRYNTDEFSGNASECYARFVVPTFLESSDKTKQSQDIMNAWHRLVTKYISNIKKAFRFLISSGLATEFDQQSASVINAGNLETPRQIRAAYAFVKSKCPEFPVFYNRYRFVREMESQRRNYSVATPSFDYFESDHGRQVDKVSFQRCNFFSREKLLLEICRPEHVLHSGAFSKDPEIIKGMFEDRGLLLKTIKPKIPESIQNHSHVFDIDQVDLDLTRLAGDFYFQDTIKVLNSFFSGDSQTYRAGSAIKIRDSVMSLIQWFRQRREDSIWGRTYRNQYNNTPNLPIEQPGVTCGRSPFYADGRTSMKEFSLIGNSLCRALINKYIDFPPTTEDPSDMTISEEYGPQVAELMQIFNKYRIEAATALNNFKNTLNINFNDPTGYYLYLITFGLDEWYRSKKQNFGYQSQSETLYPGLTTNEPGARSGGLGAYNLSTEQAPFVFRLMEVFGAMRYDSQGFSQSTTMDQYIKYSDSVGVIYGGADLSDRPAPRRPAVRTGCLNYGNNLLSIHRGCSEFLELLPPDFRPNIMSADIESDQSRYGIYYEISRVNRDMLRTLQECPLHHLNEIGINSSETQLKNLYGDHTSGQLYAHGDPIETTLFSLTTARCFNQIQRITPEFLRFKAAQELATTIEASYFRALTSVGIQRLVNILYDAITDVTGDFEQRIFDRYIMNTEISHGIRAMLAIPARSGTAQLGLDSIGTPYFKNTLDEQRMGSVLSPQDSFIETCFLANFEEVINLEDPCWNTTTIDKLEDRFNQLSAHRFDRIQEEKDFQVYFDYLIPINTLTSTVAMYNTSLLGSYNTFPLLLDSTKNMLGTAFYESVKKTMGGAGTIQDTTLQDIGLSVLDGASVFDTTAKNARPGGSKRGDCDLFPVDFGDYIKMLGDMLEEFVKFVPSMILRGIANQIDPAYKEMKHHWNSCNLNGFAFNGNGRGKPLTYVSRKRVLDLGVQHRHAGQRRQKGRYAPANLAFIADLALGIGNLDAELIGTSLDKFITYIYSGQLPMLDPSWAFQIPCIDIDNSGDDIKDWNWSKYKFGNNGRYGHPVTPFTYLALATPIMRRDLKDQRFKCRILDDGGTENSSGRNDLEEC